MRGERERERERERGREREREREKERGEERDSPLQGPTGAGGGVETRAQFPAVEVAATTGCHGDRATGG